MWTTEYLSPCSAYIFRLTHNTHQCRPWHMGFPRLVLGFSGKSRDTGTVISRCGRDTVWAELWAGGVEKVNTHWQLNDTGDCISRSKQVSVHCSTVYVVFGSYFKYLNSLLFSIISAYLPHNLLVSVHNITTDLQ